MIRNVKLDPWFSNQPEKGFLSDLTSPVHQEKPASFGQNGPRENEVDISGLYLCDPPEDPLLKTMLDDFHRFLKITEMEGARVPLRFVLQAPTVPEAFTLTVTEDEVTLSAGECEGFRRGLVFIEDELTRHEGPYLTLGSISRKPWMRRRITRCFFSPINRPPKFGDELSDDIDYYPEEYLNRLAHDGANGVWIYSRFSDLVPSRFLPRYGKGSAPRIAKLNRVIEKCARYGIAVYLFAIEPVALTPEDAALFPEVDGGLAANGNHLFCVNTPEGKAFCEELGAELFRRAPGLGGLISITYGERPTSCSSAFSQIEGSYAADSLLTDAVLQTEDLRFPDNITGGTEILCPRCKELPPGQVVANAAEALRSGVRKVKPEADVISWTYGDRFFPFDDVREYVQCAPNDVMLMQNFEEMGVAQQLGRNRLGVDYWLSYAGPSPLFRITAEEAQKCGKHMFMKTQVCCSHELATVPYVPVPGLIFEKYRSGRALGVEGVMQCWYFGNYPSFMSKAAGELAFLDDFSDKNAFLESLAAIVWGRSKAAVIAEAWRSFEAGYAQYPLNIMFSYYGPMHDGPVWNLSLEPKNFSLPRSWQTLDPTDGDRIGECLLMGHSMEEALYLTEQMSCSWNRGLELLTSVPAEGLRQHQEVSAARACGLLFASGHAILDFYHHRDALGISGLSPNRADLSLSAQDLSPSAQDLSPMQHLSVMESLVRAEIERSKALSALCEADPRLGYHSEGEGYKYFPAKLSARIEQLETLLKTEFPRVQTRIEAGQAPLPYYLGQEPDARVYTLLRPDPENAADPRKLLNWMAEKPYECVGAHAGFRAAIDGSHLYLEFFSEKDEPILISPEFRLFYPQIPVTIRNRRIEIMQGDLLYYGLIGSRVREELDKWQLLPLEGTCHYLIILSRKTIGLSAMRPFRLRIQIGDALWCEEQDPIRTLGKFTVSPLEHGWLM